MVKMICIYIDYVKKNTDQQQPNQVRIFTLPDSKPYYKTLLKNRECKVRHSSKTKSWKEIKVYILVFNVWWT